MGDNFENINNSVIVNRSHAVTAQNNARSSAGDTAAEALKNVTDEVEKSADPRAISFLNRFNEEMSKSPPDKMFLKTYWDGLVQVLPAVKEVAGAAGAIAKLFV